MTPDDLQMRYMDCHRIVHHENPPQENHDHTGFRWADCLAASDAETITALAVMCRDASTSAHHLKDDDPLDSGRPRKYVYNSADMSALFDTGVTITAIAKKYGLRDGRYVGMIIDKYRADHGLKGRLIIRRPRACREYKIGANLLSLLPQIKALMNGKKAPWGIGKRLGIHPSTVKRAIKYIIENDASLSKRSW